MPRVIVKLWPGKSETQKCRLADRIANDVMDVLGYGEESVSVAFEEISSGEWAEKVYETDIQNPRGKLSSARGDHRFEIPLALGNRASMRRRSSEDLILPSIA